MAKKTTKKKEVKILQIIIAILIAAFGGYFAKDYVLDPYEPLPLEEYYLEDEEGYQFELDLVFESDTSYYELTVTDDKYKLTVTFNYQDSLYKITGWEIT